MGGQELRSRNWRAVVAIALLAGLPAAAWVVAGRTSLPPIPMTRCEGTADLAKRAVEGSPLARMTEMRVMHLGEALPLPGAEAWLPADAYACRAPVITSTTGRDVLIWRVDPAPELGSNQVLVRGAIGEGMAFMLRDRR